MLRSEPLEKVAEVKLPPKLAIKALALRTFGFPYSLGKNSYLPMNPFMAGGAETLGVVRKRCPLPTLVRICQLEPPIVSAHPSGEGF